MDRKTRKLRSRIPVYNAADYNSNDGMLTSVWGPAIWHYLHTMSFNYPVAPSHKDKTEYRDFVLSLQHVLPCGKCRKNLTKTFHKFPLTMNEMESRDVFSKYIYELHEIVNKMLNKKSGLSYDEVRERYEHFRARCAKGGKGRTLKQQGSKEKGPTQNGSKEKGSKEKGSKEKGCVVPLYGKKARCLIQIVPNDIKTETLRIDQKCVKTRIEM